MPECWVDPWEGVACRVHSTDGGGYVDGLVNNCTKGSDSSIWCFIEIILLESVWTILAH